MAKKHWIAHRGNIFGPDPKQENHPDYLTKAIEEGYEVECDIWGVDGALWLGHDGPQYEVPVEFLTKHIESLWLHCKNAEAFGIMITRHALWNFFWHQKDDYVITSHLFIWCFPGKNPPAKVDCIVVMPEYDINVAAVPAYLHHHNAEGVCSDYIGTIRKA